ncbi:MAG: NADH-quinone oxidoreductase subunit L [Acidimicrobiales bacterium]
MLSVVWLIPALPLAGFVLILLFGRRLGEPRAGWLATATVTGSFVVSAGVFFDLLSRSADERQVVHTLFQWVPVGGLRVDLGFLADPLSITMALFVTGVGALIHLYAVGYMHGDANFSKFFLYMNLFAFSMLMLVLGDNLLVTFLGWEGVGTCSYFLIAFWFTRDTAARAAKKAFVTNRVGDWGFMIAMFLTWSAVGSLNYVDVLGKADSLSHSTATAIALLLFLGACGKSAQLPLYVWLPDAMEGPTPVSALIHAATMVTAGVYLMCRVNPILAEAKGALTVIAIVGAVTALFAATCAVAQNDIKRVLAYSTISQLGYMFLAVGSGAYVAAVFHMVTHAFFKALMFLGAGSVIHGTHDEQDMRRMGALRKLMPVTAVTFIIGWLAIAGVPPFAGFWSKDEILLHAWDKSPALWAIGLVTALLTAYYMSRQVFMVFYGDARWGDENRPHGEKPHESPWIMLTPLVVLAGLSIVGGGLNLPFTSSTKLLDRWLEPVFGDRLAVSSFGPGGKWALAILATLAGLAGIAVAYAVYLRKRVKAFEPEILARAWGVDDAYSAFVGGPGRRSFLAVEWFDRTIIDGAVNGAGAIAKGAGTGLRRLQTGYVRNYALGIAVGAVALLAWFISRGAW